MFSVPGITADNILITLDNGGFEVSTGSACSSGKVEASKTLEAMRFANNILSSSIRVSLGPYNNYEEAIFAKTVKKKKIVFRW